MTHCTGIVVIGRNEGERLIASLQSVRSQGCAVVYVDSGSSDGSAALARSSGEAVIELDPVRPFSAARARNEGFAALLASEPTLSLVQFIDGDCTLLPGWIASASAAMAADARRAVVIGPLRERRPEASVYNRLCAMEWKSPAGDLNNFGALGGIMLVRAEVFVKLGGFNEQVIAGEDSEFGVRVGLAGLAITKIDTPMATHDADIHRFGQWWRRTVRAGHAIGQRFSLNGHAPMHDCARERRSVLIWGLGLPITILVSASWTSGASLLLAAGYAVLGARIARHRLALGDSQADSWLYARFVVLAKFAEALGLIKFYLNRIAGQFRIIEYK
ncbi:MAG: glycosyltransferase family 2 protein [Ramlibacter sp.]|nr:glycosyltransferase family 2 protein [Ramlibacter sp.]